MTTIVASLTEMAADSWESGGGRIVKLMKGPSLVVGYAGEVYQGIRLAKWVLDGCRGAPPVPPDADVELLILRKTGISTMDGEGTEVPYDLPYYSIGSGSAVALGALWSGKSPAEAIEAAAFHDGSTKLPVHTVKLPRK